MIFSPEGPDTSHLCGPIPLTCKHLDLPPKCGLYLITCGDCLVHVGTSVNIKNRVRQLALLGTHRGSTEVLCAAFCTKQEPLVWWEMHENIKAARKHEKEFKEYYGEPPSPHSVYGSSCKNGQRLRDELVNAAGRDSWEAGCIEATFAIGEMLNILFERNKFRKRFPRRDFSIIERILEKVGRPHGPWSQRSSENSARF